MPETGPMGPGGKALTCTSRRAVSRGVDFATCSSARHHRWCRSAWARCPPIPHEMYLTDVCTVPANLAGQPAISVPGGSDPDGLPIGVQFMAPALREDLLIRAAGAVEGRR